MHIKFVTDNNNWPSVAIKYPFLIVLTRGYLNIVTEVGSFVQKQLAQVKQLPLPCLTLANSFH